jgi:hypothetical protein
MIAFDERSSRDTVAVTSDDDDVANISGISQRVTHINNDIALLSRYPTSLIDMIMSYYGNPVITSE